MSHCYSSTYYKSLVEGNGQENYEYLVVGIAYDVSCSPKRNPLLISQQLSFDKKNKKSHENSTNPKQQKCKQLPYQRCMFLYIFSMHILI